jgi:hypothetical protein
MSETVYKTLGEILERIAQDGIEGKAMLDLAEAGIKERTEDAAQHMERALALYQQANIEVEAARVHLSKAYFDIRVRGLIPWPDADEMIIRVTTARDRLLGKDGPGLRRQKKHEKEQARKDGGTDCHGAEGASQ